MYSQMYFRAVFLVHSFCFQTSHIFTVFWHTFHFELNACNGDTFVCKSTVKVYICKQTASVVYVLRVGNRRSISGHVTPNSFKTVVKAAFINARGLWLISCRQKQVHRLDGEAVAAVREDWFDPRLGHTKYFKICSNGCPPWRSGLHND